ncbi:MAG TPA: tetratricopeptide repeat protein [Chloroflexia bacterium]|nr:tetratricopeptide repeat protein [Chloroflexia bacterium]
MKATYENSAGSKMVGKVAKGLGSNLVLMIAIALVLAGGSVLAARLFGSNGWPAASSGAIINDPSAILAAGTGTNSGIADRTIATAQQQIKQIPDDYKAYVTLGYAFQQKARETSDPNFYVQAEDALTRALTLKPNYYEAMAGLGQLNLSRHEFVTALDWGLQAQAQQPSSAYAYGVIGDAQIELGRYDQAVQTFQKMVDLRPDISSYSRVSYARELYGDVPGAIEAMQQAVNAGAPAQENTAWCRVQLGNLYFNSNQLDKAEQAYNDALSNYPDYLHAEAGLALVAWAQGRDDDAVKLYQQSVANVPLPQYLTSLGDLYNAMGDTANAKKQLDLVLYIYQVFQAGGVNVDMEKSAYLADHVTGDNDLKEAVTLAERAASVRQDVHTMDALGWVYYKAGRYQDALQAEQKAVRLGTLNALFYFHLGMIQDKLGDATDAKANVQKALDINPFFSIQYMKTAQDFVRN